MYRAVDPAVSLADGEDFGLVRPAYAPKRPLWCFDERPCQLLGDTLVPIAMKPGKTWRYDHHYERHGVCHLLIAFQPHTGQRVVKVCQRRTASEYVEFMRDLKAIHNPDAEQVVLVQDNLNLHAPSSFYTLLPPAEAFALSKQFDMHYTPVNASWLNMVEIELSVLARQCLDRRLTSIERLQQKVLCLVAERNRQAATVRWQFTPQLARIKFERFYPKLAANPHIIYLCLFTQRHSCLPVARFPAQRHYSTVRTELRCRSLRRSLWQHRHPPLEPTRL